MARHFYQMLATLLCVCCVRAHKCEHDEFIASHNATPTVSPQTYLHHPFEKTQQDADAPRRLDAANWQPIRIHVDSSTIALDTFSSDGKATYNMISSSIIPSAIKILSNHLSVIRVNGNLKVSPTCSTYGSDGQTCCTSNPDLCKWDANVCYHVSVPDSHFTPGVADADFVVYLTANEETTHGQTMALGATCRTDQHDRPLAGQVSLNLAVWKGQNGLPLAKNYMVSTLVHEMSHALGWSHDAFSRFRDENGNLRENVITTKSALGKQISLLSTPAVTSHVRSHFGCSSLTGMEIEDQGGTGTAGSHPEKRIYPESYMAGVSARSDSDFIIEAMALSVFQDSGWYQVKNLDQAGKLSWGRGMGCRVATHRCNDFGQEAEAMGLFCSNQTSKFCTGNYKNVIAHCDLTQYTSSLPSMFQYFSDPTAGGSTQIADFCPRSEKYYNSDCTDPINQHQSPVLGTLVSSDSRCFFSSLQDDRYIDAGLTVDARCFKRTCHPTKLVVHLNGKTIDCPVSNQPTTITVAGYIGQFVCPAYKGMDDIRCTSRCSKDDPECLGIKGSAVDLSGPDFGGGHAHTDGGSVVVVHGRRHLRH